MDSTSVANNFSDTLIDSLLDSGHRTQQQILRAGDIALLNTRIIHSGTEYLRKNRRIITKYLDYDSARNKVFMRFARLVADTEGIAHLRVRHPDRNNAILLDERSHST